MIEQGARNIYLEAALEALFQGNVGLVILKEINLTDGIHTCYGTGYLVWATEAESCHQGGGGFSGVAREGGLSGQGGG